MNTPSVPESTPSSATASNQPTVQNRPPNYIKRAVLLSFGASQVVAPLVILAKTINALWNVAKLGIVSLHKMGIERKIAYHKPMEKGQTIETLQALLRLDEVQQQEALASLKEDAHGFVIALLSLLPGVGILVGGAYAQKMHRQGPVEASLRGAEGVSRHLLGGLPGAAWAGRKALYPLSWSPAKDSYKTEEISRFHTWIQDGITLNEIKIKLLGIQEFKTAYLRDSESIDPKLLELMEEEKNRPLTRKECQDICFRVQSFLKTAELEARYTEVEVNRGDGKKHALHCSFINTNSNPAAKTMVLFHANGVTGDDMTQEATLYKEKGWNVLMVTMGGYPGSDEGVDTSEETTIQDVYAILHYLENQKVTTIGCHGLSIGSTMAMQAAQLRPDIVKIVICDKPLDSAQGVSANLLHNIGRKEPLLNTLLPSAVVRGVIGASFPKGVPVRGIPDVVTDGCDNVAKAKEYTGILVTLAGARDTFMGRDWNENGIAQDTLSADLYKAHKQKDEKKSFIAFTDVPHTSSLNGLERRVITHALHTLKPPEDITSGQIT